MVFLNSPYCKTLYLERWFDRDRGWRGFAQKVIDNIGHACETIYPAQFAVDALMAEPVAHGGARLDRLKPDAYGAEFVRRASKRVRTLHVHERCS